MIRKIFISLGIACVLLAGGLYWFQRNPQAAVTPTSGLLMPITAPDLLNTVHALKSPLVLVNFWASWCEPCKKEFPSILTLREKLAAQGLKVVFVSIDEPRDFEAAEDFLREHKVDFQTYYKGAQDLQFVSQIYPKWEGAVPTTVLFGPKQDIVEAWEGDATLAEFEKRVRRHLGGT
jgi:thiol-disulfide isomerase/thioredoxin